MTPVCLGNGAVFEAHTDAGQWRTLNGTVIEREHVESWREI